MKKLIQHFTLLYFWLEKYFHRKGIRNSTNVALSIILTLPLIYLMIYIVAPIVALFFENGNDILREYKWLLACIFSFLILPSILIFTKRSNIDKQIQELSQIKNWENSEMYRKGRYWIRFHLYFPYLSLIFIISIGALLILWIK